MSRKYSKVLLTCVPESEQDLNYGQFNNDYVMPFVRAVKPYDWSCHEVKEASGKTAYTCCFYFDGVIDNRSCFFKEHENVAVSMKPLYSFMNIFNGGVQIA